MNTFTRDLRNQIGLLDKHLTPWARNAISVVILVACGVIVVVVIWVPGEELSLAIIPAIVGLIIAPIAGAAMARKQEGVLVVKDGESYVTKSRGAFAGWRTKNFLIVYPGQIAVLERGGRITTVRGSGITTLALFENVYRIVPTKWKSVSGVVEDAFSTEGLSITIEFAVFYRLLPQEDGSRAFRGFGEYDFDEDAVERAISVRDLDAAILYTAQSIVQDTVAKFSFLDGEMSVSELERQADTRLQSVVRYWLGMQTTLLISNLRLSAEARRQILQDRQLRSEAERKDRELRAEAERKAVELAKILNVIRTETEAVITPELAQEILAILTGYHFLMGPGDRLDFPEAPRE